MRRPFLFALALALAVLPASVRAQRKRLTREERFVASKPAVGDALPQLTVYTPDGKPFKMAELRGHYAVLVFGCLT